MHVHLSEYVDRQWCQKDVGNPYGSNWNPDWGEFDLYSNVDGVDALAGCCDCISSDAANYQDRCVITNVYVIDGPLFQAQHILCSVVYGVTTLLLAVLTVKYSSVLSKKKDGQCCSDITMLTLLGLSACSIAKAGIYTARFISIWMVFEDRYCS